MDIEAINRRVDQALSSNKRAEAVITGLAVGIFVLGEATLLMAYSSANPYIASGTLVLQGFLYWPIREVRQLRRENLALQAAPILVQSLPPDRAMREIERLLDFIRKGKA